MNEEVLRALSEEIDRASRELGACYEAINGQRRRTVDAVTSAVGAMDDEGGIIIRCRSAVSDFDLALSRGMRERDKLSAYRDGLLKARELMAGGL